MMMHERRREYLTNIHQRCLYKYSGLPPVDCSGKEEDERYCHSLGATVGMIVAVKYGWNDRTLVLDIILEANG
jgi:hypothetical protein